MPKGSQYPPMTALNGTERLLGVQGTATETVTLDEIAAYAAVAVGAVTLDTVEGLVAPKADTATLAATNGASLVGFAQAGATAAPRTILDKLRDTMSVKDFGAVGDGVTDDTTAIQWALDVGREVFVPPGTYLVGELFLKDGSCLVGASANSVIFRASPSIPLDTGWIRTHTTGAGSERPTKNVRLSRITFDGSLRDFPRWLTNPVTGEAITDPEADYYDAVDNPAGKIGNPSFPDYDIFDAVAENRRNGSYADAGSAIVMNKIDRPEVSDCIFTNYRARCIHEAGCKNALITRNRFKDCGKDDGPFPAVWSQSYGTPGGGQAFYAPSEDTTVTFNVFEDLERCAAIFSPTKGGLFAYNRTNNTGESCVFINPNAGYDGGTIRIVGNDFGSTYITDIISNHIEAGGAKNLTISGNRFTGSAEQSLILTGCINTKVVDNEFIECVTGDGTLPYGPFSERYGYSVGSAPIAGNSYAPADAGYIDIGSLGATGCNGVYIRGNVFTDSRTTNHAKSLFRPTKSGTDNASSNCYIENNDVVGVAAVPFLDTAITSVWSSSPRTLFIRGNRGHASETVAVINHQIAIGGTGITTFDIGFMPSRIEVQSTTNNSALGRFGFGLTVWKRDGNHIDHALSLTVDAAAAKQRAGFSNDEFLRLVDGDNNVRVSVEFVGFTETGFSINTITALDLTNTRLICHP